MGRLNERIDLNGRNSLGKGPDIKRKNTKRWRHNKLNEMPLSPRSWIELQYGVTLSTRQERLSDGRPGLDICLLSCGSLSLFRLHTLDTIHDSSRRVLVNWELYKVVILIFEAGVYTAFTGLHLAVAKHHQILQWKPINSAPLRHSGRHCNRASSDPKRESLLFPPAAAKRSA